MVDVIYLNMSIFDQLVAEKKKRTRRMENAAEKYHNFRLELYCSQRLRMQISGKDIFSQRFILQPIKNLRKYIAIVNHLLQ
jgi:hypothetical protein